MTVLSADAPLKFRGEPKTEKYILDTAAAQIIYRGVPLMIDDNSDTEHVVISSAITVTTSDCFVGIAAEGRSVAAGTLEREETAGIEVYVEPTIIGFKSTVFTLDEIGKVVSMSDTGALVAGTGGTYPRIGKLFKVEDGYAFVQLETPWVQA
jgi:hypothetical protein